MARRLFTGFHGSGPTLEDSSGLGASSVPVRGDDSLDFEVDFASRNRYSGGISH